MDRTQQTVAAVVEPSRQGAGASFLLAVTAAVAHLALLDAAFETFVSGSPLRWWVSPAFVGVAAVSLWLWRPWRKARGRVVSTSAAAVPAVGLLALLAVSAWVPGGHETGVRIFLLPTPRLLLAAVALTVLVAAFMLVRRVGALTAAPRRVGRMVVIGLALYALVALGLAYHRGSAFEAVFQGGAEWQRLPYYLQGPMVGSCLLLPLAILAYLVASLRRAGLSALLGWRVCPPIALALVCSIALSGVFIPQNPYTRQSGTDVPAVDARTLALALKDLRQAIGAAPDGSSVAPALARSRLENVLARIADEARELPKDTFDPQAIVDAVGRDPALLCAWVRDNTDPVSYTGVLRGPTGVLMDRTGNSLDRSLLLAELLRLAGVPARLAHARLSPDQARAVTGGSRARPGRETTAVSQQIRWPRPPVDMVRDLALGVQGDPAVFQTMAENLKRAAEADLAAARRRTAEQSQLLLTALGQQAAGHQPPDADLGPPEHWWVQYERQGQWIDCDAEAPDATPGTALAAADLTVAPKDLAAELFWVVEIRVAIERWSGGRLTEDVVLSHRVRVVDAAYLDMTLRHVPLDWPKSFNRDGGATALEAAVGSAHQWVPILTVGSRRIIQSGFTDAGTVIKSPGKSAMPSAAGLFGGLFGGEDSSNAKSDGILTAEWVDYGIVPPGGASQRLRRESFDLIGPALRSGGQVPAPALDDAARLRRGLTLLGDTAIMIQTAKLSREYLAHRGLSRLLANRQALLALQDPNGADAKAATKAFRQLFPASDLLWSYALARFQLPEGGADVYLDSPGIATMRTTVVVGPDRSLRQRLLFDIVSNEVAVRPQAPSGGYPTRIRQGVADTIAEVAVQLGADRADNASDVFRANMVDQGTTILVRGGADQRWKQAGFTPDVVARVERDVAAGHDIVLPGAPVTLNGSKRAAWWRVSQATGTTVGVMDSGYNEGLIEEAILLFDDVLEAVIPAGIQTFFMTASEGTILLVEAFMFLLTGFTLTSIWLWHQRQMEEINRIWGSYLPPSE